MHLQFIPMIQFSRVLKAGNFQREFNFRKLRTKEAEVFNVNVCDEKGNRIFFVMQKQDNDWKIMPGQFPPWVAQNESRLHGLIEEELTGFNG